MGCRRGFFSICWVWLREILGMKEEYVGECTNHLRIHMVGHGKGEGNVGDDGVKV